MTGTRNIGRLRRIAHRRAVVRRQRLGRHRFRTRADAGSNPTQGLSLLILSLPGLAALAALLFTWMQVNQASKELQISERGQVTGRFNSAVANLASDSIDLRLGGIYSLEGIMNDSSRDQPAIVTLLTAYVRRRAPAPTSATPAQESPPADIEAVMNVLAGRQPAHDRGKWINLSHTNLSGWGQESYQRLMNGINLENARLDGTNLSEAVIQHAQLRGALLDNANLRGASLFDSDLSGAILTGADLRDAGLDKTNLTDAWFCGGDRPSFKYPGPCPDMTGVILINANLTRASLVGANLSGAYLRNADLTGADLWKANLSKADLSKANLSGAILTGAKLDGARLDGARGLPPSLLRERERQEKSPPG
ncbi:pentapeptide repeat-containing protein [Streptomyces diastatochromogenes]|uniref:pentapeptide repeat-containing protein n=1 Tax=Streptomyces diastatochromogenes TaxID=42236 RepID=UPI00365A3E98